MSRLKQDVADAFSECVKMRESLAAEERQHEATIAERDEAQEAADNLVGVVERFLGVECGEHSNLNDPWAEALSFMEAEIARRNAGAKV